MRSGLSRSAQYWPTPERELLLEAGLMPGERGLSAWRSWRAAVDLDDVDHRSQQLLPLVYRNLGSTAPDDPDWAIVRGVYRRTWTSNQLLFNEARRLVALLEKAGVPTLILKGMALAHRFYADIGVRAMTDVDVLVPLGSAPVAIDVLAANGWQSPMPWLGDALEVWQSSAVIGPSGRELDLHWNVFWQPSDESEIWSRAEPLELAGARTLAMAPTDQLLHVLVHGTYWSPLSFRWVADAVTVIRRSEIDWELLVAVASARRVTWGLAEMLAYLAERFDVQADAAAIGALAAIPVPAGTRRGHVAMASPTGWRRELAVHWDRYRRLSILRGTRPGAMGFASHLRKRWGYETNRQLAARAGRRTAEAAGRRLGSLSRRDEQQAPAEPAREGSATPAP